MEKETESVVNSESRPLWRRPIIVAVALLIVAAAFVVACAVPAINPDESQATTEDAATVESQDAAEQGTENQDTANAGAATEPAGEDVAAEAEPSAAESNPADQYAVDTEPSEEFNGIPVGLTVSGLPYKGDPDAPVILVEFSDYQCPFCGRHFVQTEPALTEKYVRNGQMRSVFVDFPLEGLHPNAPAAHAASLCVLDQGSVENYWKMHGALFTSVDEWGSVFDPTDIFLRLAEESGADADAVKACLDDGTVRQDVNASVDFSMSQGFQGTPSFQLIRVEDGAMSQFSGAQPFEQFEAQIDLLLSGGMPEQTAQEAGGAAEIPFWATPEGWQPDPDRPGYNMAGDEYKGDIDAPIQVIEFSDFQCPYCRRHAQDAQPTLDEKYVDTGEILWIFKHFPLTIHPQAPAAGVAAECAAEQGKFWEMAEALFNSQSEWSVSDPNPVLSGVAEDLGLDMEAFSACLDDEEMANRVASDTEDGAPFVRGTPTFIILHDGSGSIVPGALPVDSFTQIFDELLAAGGGE
ncbi:MAG: DsbA family protein [Caldilineaceae bacterium]